MCAEDERAGSAAAVVGCRDGGLFPRGRGVVERAGFGEGRGEGGGVRGREMGLEVEMVIQESGFPS